MQNDKIISDVHYLVCFSIYLIYVTISARITEITEIILTIEYH